MCIPESTPHFLVKNNTPPYAEASERKLRDVGFLEIIPSHRGGGGGGGGIEKFQLE